MGGKAPKAPDPYKVSAAQTKSNIETAKAQQQIGMVGQTTPTGSISYVIDPTSPSGYRAVTQLSPEEQALFSQGQNVKAAVLGNVGNTVSTPFDLNASRGTEISDMQRTFLDPVWNQRSEALSADLMNRGIRPGSDAYAREMRMFNQQKSDAYDKMFLDAYQTGNNSALMERNIPISDFTALSGIGQPATPQFQPTAQPGVAATDLSGNVNNAYNQQVSQANSAMGGLYGLGSAALGGWASSGGLGSALAGLAALSDKRAKTDIIKIGDDPRGWGVYQYRYKGADKTQDTWQVGYMAQEVEKIRPDAVITSPSTGIKFVDYGKLAA